MAANTVIGLLVTIFGGAFGIWGWIAAAVAVLVLAPVLARIEYKITGREFPRA
jgi:hypothetical protein